MNDGDCVLQSRVSDPLAILGGGSVVVSNDSDSTGGAQLSKRRIVIVLTLTSARVAMCVVRALRRVRAHEGHGREMIPSGRRRDGEKTYRGVRKDYPTATSSLLLALPDQHFQPPAKDLLRPFTTREK
jgi:hypothetical protein